MTPEDLDRIRQDQERVNAEQIRLSAEEHRDWPTDRAIKRPNGKANGAPASHLNGKTTVASLGQLNGKADTDLVLRLDGRQNIIRDEENVLRILAQDVRLLGVVRFNEFASELMLWRPLPASSIEDVVAERDTPRPWGDTDTTAVQAFIQAEILPGIGRDKVEAALALHADRHGRFHPLRDYLQGLQWDQQPRLCDMLADYFGAYGKGQPETFIAEVGLRWMVSAVARIMRPGCQADHMLVLEGDQGVRKSTALRILAGDENFSDGLPHDLAHKDAKDHTRGKWIIELPELTQFKRNEIETLKAFITRREEVFRPAYGRHEIRAPRQCVFAGTTNDSEYLVDTTGNRRFWGVAIGEIDLDGLRRDRNQLWAEATHLYRAGERWHLDASTEQVAASEARLRMATDPWAGVIYELLATDHRLAASEVTPGQVLSIMDLREAERTPSNAKRVANVLTSLGWRHGRKSMKGRCYLRPKA